MKTTVSGHYEYTHSWDYSALYQGSMCVEGGEGGVCGGGEENEAKHMKCVTSRQ